MPTDSPLSDIYRLFEKNFGCPVLRCEEISACGSYRRYFRLKAQAHPEGMVVDASGCFSVMGCWNADIKENAAFVSFARRFHEAGLPVPRIYAVDEPSCIYLQEDLGNESLYDRVKRLWLEPLAADASYPFPEELMDLYRQSLSRLVRLQVTGREVIDYSYCTPCPAFHRDAIHWDLNYFKYFFLKLMRVPFDEQALEDDFRTFSAYLLEADCSYFLFRDFQSANIMLRDNSVYFIDFQGGRKGALQYDPASLLFDAKTLLPSSVRSQLIAYYYSELTRFVSVSASDFYAYYQGYTLCRLLQALAAFGLRGVVEHKPGFRESIPPALSMLADILAEWCLPIDLPELKQCLSRCQNVEVEA